MCQGSTHVAISCCWALKGEEQPGARSTPGLVSAGACPCARMVLSPLLYFSPVWLSQKSCKEGSFSVEPQQRTARPEPRAQIAAFSSFLQE